MLNEEYTIDTPENVTFGYDVAGIGSRFIGALVDSLILGVLLFFWNFLLIIILSVALPNGSADFFESDEAVPWVVGLVIAAYALINFVLLWGYYILFELIWHGQTPGKRVAGIRVVRMDGNAIGFLENVIRNLVRIIDFLPMGYGVGLITMFCNRHARRLGDYAAGTLVIREQKVENIDEFLVSTSEVEQSHQSSLASSSTERKSTSDTADADDPSTETALAGLSSAMSAPPPDVDPLRKRFATIHQLSSLDFELLVDTLSRHEKDSVSPAILQRMSSVLAEKLEMEMPQGQEDAKFLGDMAEAYKRYHR